MKNFVITVARGFGSGGRAIAAKLADELNIHSYDNRILTLASQYSDYPNVVSIYVEAPRSYTLRRVMERMDDITVEEAHHLITKTDKYRADYYKYYTGGNYWTNPVNYDLTFNNARLGDDRCVKLVLECMKLKFGDDFKEYMKSIGKDI